MKNSAKNFALLKSRSRIWDRILKNLDVDRLKSGLKSDFRPKWSHKWAQKDEVEPNAFIWSVIITILLWSTFIVCGWLNVKVIKTLNVIAQSSVWNNFTYFEVTFLLQGKVELGAYTFWKGIGET